jgi:hypothetical protein
MVGDLRFLIGDSHAFRARDTGSQVLSINHHRSAIFNESIIQDPQINNQSFEMKKAGL